GSPRGRPDAASPARAFGIQARAIVCRPLSPLEVGAQPQDPPYPPTPGPVSGRVEVADASVPGEDGGGPIEIQMLHEVAPDLVVAVAEPSGLDRVCHQ